MAESHDQTAQPRASLLAPGGIAQRMIPRGARDTTQVTLACWLFLGGVFCIAVLGAGALIALVAVAATQHWPWWSYVLFVPVLLLLCVSGFCVCARGILASMLLLFAIYSLHRQTDRQTD